jgi:tripartite ATP-independent transporter DctP family solute receptor
MRKWLTGVLLMVMSFSLVLAGCGGSEKPAASSSASGSPASGSPAANGEKITLRLAHHLAIDSTQNKALLKIKEEVESKTNGRVELQIFPASQMGSQREVIEGVKIGTIDMGLGDHGYLQSYVPEYGLFDLPYLFRDVEHTAKVLNGPVEEQISKKLLDEHGLRHLGWMSVGFRGVMTTKKEINSAEALKGLKIRVPESEVLKQTFSRLGASPTPMPFGEIYTGLETKIVDAVEGVPESLFSSKIHEVTKTFTMTGHSQISIGPVISEKVWQKLPQDIQQILQEAIDKAMADSTAEAQATNDKAIQSMKDSGLTIVDIAPEEIEKMKATLRPYWEEYAAKVNGADLLKLMEETK